MDNTKKEQDSFGNDHITYQRIDVYWNYVFSPSFINKSIEKCPIYNPINF